MNSHKYNSHILCIFFHIPSSSMYNNNIISSTSPSTIFTSHAICENLIPYQQSTPTRTSFSFINISVCWFMTEPLDVIFKLNFVPFSQLSFKPTISGLRTLLLISFSSTHRSLYFPSITFSHTYSKKQNLILNMKNQMYHNEEKMKY